MSTDQTARHIGVEARIVKNGKYTKMVDGYTICPEGPGAWGCVGGGWSYHHHPSLDEVERHNADSPPPPTESGMGTVWDMNQELLMEEWLSARGGYPW